MNLPPAQSISDSTADDVTAGHDPRRARIVREALTLAVDGAELNIRRVADRAHLPLATVDQYFRSRDHLHVAAFGLWLEHYERRLDAELHDLDDPYVRIWQVLELLNDAMRDIPMLADAMARAFALADSTIVVDVESVRAQMIDMFAKAMRLGTPTDSGHDIAGLLTDVLTSNMLALAHKRTTALEVRRRFAATVAILGRANAPCSFKGEPDD